MDVASVSVTQLLQFSHVNYNLLFQFFAFAFQTPCPFHFPIRANVQSFREVKIRLRRLLSQRVHGLPDGIVVCIQLESHFILTWVQLWPTNNRVRLAPYARQLRRRFAFWRTPQPSRTWKVADIKRKTSKMILGPCLPFPHQGVLDACPFSARHTTRKNGQLILLARDFLYSDFH